MYSNRRVLAVVPARGGSKGVPLKNLRPVRGVSLVARVGRIVQEIAEIDRAVVSTDHDEIVAVAERAGLAAPFYRPEALSGDRVGDLDVLVHALEACEAIDGLQYDMVLMLQPTSPLRTAEHVRDTLRMLIDEACDSVWTVSETDPKYHPLKQLTLEDGSLGFYDAAGDSVIARQQLKPVYHRNGAAYAFSRDCLLGQRSIMGVKARAVVTATMISIDTLEDFQTVESLMRERGID